MKDRSQFFAPVAKAGRWSAIALGGALLFGVGGANTASAFGDPLGTAIGPAGATLSFTLSTDPAGADTSPVGGGPFQLTLGNLSAGPTLSALGIPTSVQAWCVEIAEHIAPGTLNTGAQLLAQAGSEIGGVISEGLKFLNVANTGGTGGTVSFTAAGTAFIAANPLLNGKGWDAGEVGAAIQDLIWKLQLNNPLATTVGNQSATETTNLLNAIETYALANQTGYFRLHKDGVQDEVFAVPGPIVGAGLPGLLLACAALFALARRRQVIA